MTMMTPSHDSLDRLVREALGEPVDPAPARRACRAALQLSLAEARRRERRRQANLAIAAGLMLVFGLAGPLGSDDFNLKMEKSFKNGHEIRKYVRGVAGDMIGTYGPDDPRSLSEAEVSELFQQYAAGQYTAVELSGWQVGDRKHFFTLLEAWSGVQWIWKDCAADGYPVDLPRWFLEILQKFPTLILRTDEIIEHRAPDFQLTMTSNDLEWDVKAWHLQFPGLPEITYYHGLRADGVRGH